MDGSYNTKDPIHVAQLKPCHGHGGGDCVCVDHFLSYHIGPDNTQCNSNNDYELSHDAKSVGRQTLKAVGLWRHQVVPKEMRPA